MSRPIPFSPLPAAPPHHEDTGRLFAALVRQAATPCPAQAAEGRGCIARALAEFLESLAAGARRPVRLSPRGAHKVGADERALVNLIAAIQIGREDEARLRADWLVKPAYRQALFLAAARLADALADEWIYLPVPTATTPSSPQPKPAFSAAPVETQSRRLG
ncbi:MAG: hypothetical protein ACE5FO_10835 [Parvularculaceae bacterium]